MKKLTLNTTAFAGAKELTRAEMKNVMGGNMSGSGVCDGWMTNPDAGVCYNCCYGILGDIAVSEEENYHYMDFCMESCNL
ncbi:hypothetical protein [Pedobacter frigiditerrae]|nr:hypothetical protein [Pedobacter frigiditerrae]